MGFRSNSDPLPLSPPPAQGGEITVSTDGLVAEDHGLVLVDQGAAVEMEGDRPRQHPPLDVAALADQVLRRVLMADALDILLDDRAFIEIAAGDVMGGCTRSA